MPGAKADRWPNWSLGLPKSQEELEQQILTRQIAHALRRVATEESKFTVQSC
jgi:hypothetical protein